MNAKKWLLSVVALSAAFCLLAGGINYLVDPWGLNGALMIEGFNANKIEPLATARLHKAHAVMRLHPGAVAMGTSTAEHGIDMRRGFEQRSHGQARRFILIRTIAATDDADTGKFFGRRAKAARAIDAGA